MTAKKKKGDPLDRSDFDIWTDEEFAWVAKQGNSVVWKHFVVNKEGTLAKCTQCERIINYGRQQRGNTTNLRQHLKGTHGMTL